MLKSRKFWAYDPCQAAEIKQEFIDNYKIKGRFYDDVLVFYDQIGIAPHPSLRMPLTGSTDVNAISFINDQVDINTLRILIHLLPYTKIVSLKFCSNDFEINNLDFLINSIISKQNNIYYFSYEWNDRLRIDNNEYVSRNDITQYEEHKDLFQKQNELIYSLFKNTKFEAICLRGNYLGDDTMIEIFNLLKDSENNSQVKLLSLYKNNLTGKCIDSFCSMLLKNKKLEEVNFGANDLKDEDLDKIDKAIGKYPMTTEEVEEYNKKAKERETIIAKNVKLKLTKKPELEVPYLDEMIQIGETFYIVKNKNLKVLNFMLNLNLTSKCFESVKHMLDYNDDLFITIDDHVFTPEQKEVFAEKGGNYLNRIYYSKN